MKARYLAPEFGGYLGAGTIDRFRSALVVPENVGTESVALDA